MEVLPKTRRRREVLVGRRRAMVQARMWEDEVDALTNLIPSIALEIFISWL
jgi:hypothetical protein